MVDIGNGINEIWYEADIKIYPNPTQSEINIEPNVNFSPVHVIIKDILGRELLTVNTTNTKTTIDVAALNAGVYLLQLLSKSGASVVEKFVKE